MYLVFKDNEQQGPYPADEIRERLDCGLFIPADLYWSEEKNEWLPLSDFPGLATPTPPAVDTVAATPESPEEAAPSAEGKDFLAPFLADKQPASVVRKVYETACALMGPGESIEYIAVQKKPLVNLHPECAVLTTQRIVLFHQGMFKQTHDEFLLREILALNLKKSLTRSAFTFKDATGQGYGIYSLPKVQGEKLFNIAHNLQNQIRAEFIGNISGQSASGGTAKAPNNVDVHHKLGTIKKMLDEGLISQQDYDIKKNELLERL